MALISNFPKRTLKRIRKQRATAPAAEVVQLDDRRPHFSGSARCLQCHHEWVGVAPAQTAYLQCPSCKLDRGVFVGLFHRGEPHWNCKCGNGLFAVTPNGAYCPQCNADQSLP